MQKPYNSIPRPTWSPWGQPDHAEQPIAGIWSIYTPSHGGFYVSAERRKDMPAQWLALSFNGKGKDGWFEEDVDWCMVALAFADEWKAWRGSAGETDLEAAQRTMTDWVMKRRGS